MEREILFVKKDKGMREAFMGLQNQSCGEQRIQHGFDDVLKVMKCRAGFSAIINQHSSSNSNEGVLIDVIGDLVTPYR